MDYDIRSGKYTFKHSLSESLDFNQTRFREHYHTMYELLYFLKGDADFIIQSKRYALKSGDLLVVKPGEHHHILFKSPTPYERIVLRFDPMDIQPQLRKHLPDLESVYFIQNTPLSSELSHLDAHITHVQQDILLYTFIASLNVILSYLISSQQLIQKADSIDDDLKLIIDYINHHISEIQSIDDLSQALHISKSKIYKTFHKQFDTPIMSYIRTQKIMLARDLINDGISATEVSDRLGFNHYSSFYRDFKKIFHEAPSGKAK